jgi:hypothetical protein
VRYAIPRRPLVRRAPRELSARRRFVGSRSHVRPAQGKAPVRPVRPARSARVAPASAASAAHRAPSVSTARQTPGASRGRAATPLNRRATTRPVRTFAKARGTEAELAHHEPGQPADHEHHQRPHARRVEHGLFRVQRVHDVACHLRGLARKGRRLEALGHGRLHEAGLDAQGDEPLAPELVVEALEVGRQAGLARAVEHHGLAAALSGHRAQHAQAAAAARQ